MATSTDNQWLDLLAGANRLCHCCKKPLQERKRLDARFCDDLCRGRKWTSEELRLGSLISFVFLDHLLQKAQRRLGGRFVGYSLTTERPDFDDPERHELNSFPEPRRLTKRVPTQPRDGFEMSELPYCLLVPFEAPRVPVVGEYLVHLHRADGSVVAVGMVFIPRAFRSVRFYALVGGQLFDTKGRKLAADGQRREKIEAAAHEEVARRFATQAATAGGQPQVAERRESAQESSAQPSTMAAEPPTPAMPTDPRVAYVQFALIPAHLDENGRFAEDRINQPFPITEARLGFKVDGTIIKICNPSPDDPYGTGGILVRFPKATENQMKTLKRRFAELLEARSAGSPVSEVPPSSPAMERQTQAEWFKHVRSAYTSKPRPIPPITAPPKSQ